MRSEHILNQLEFEHGSMISFSLLRLSFIREHFDFICMPAFYKSSLRISVSFLTYIRFSVLIDNYVFLSFFLSQNFIFILVFH